MRLDLQPRRSTLAGHGPLLRVLALLALALLLAAPPATAHGAGFEATAWIDGRPVDIALEGAPLPAALAPLVLRVQAPTPEGLLPAAQAQARLVPPDGGAAPGGWFPLVGDGAGRFSSPVVFASPGEWRLEVAVGGGRATVDVPVWPASPHFVEAAPATVDRGALFAGAQETVGLRVHDARDAPAPPAADAVANVVHLDESGAFVGATRVPLTASGPGVYAFEGSWPSAGTLEITVESAVWGLADGTRPPVTLLVEDPAAADVYRAEAPKDTPAPGAALLVAALAAAAGAFAAVRRRR